MGKILFILLLLLALPLKAQPPRIDSMFVNEDSSKLTIYGDVANNGAKPQVFVDSIEMIVTNWSDNFCTCTISDSGRGSIGPVEVDARGLKSNSRTISFWSGNYVISAKYPHHWDYSDSLHFRVRADIQSFIINHNKTLVTFYPAHSSYLSCVYSEPYEPNSQGGYDNFSGATILPLYYSKTRKDSSFELSCYIDISNHILNISVSSVNGCSGIRTHSYRVNNGQPQDTSYKSGFMVSDFTKNIKLDSTYGIKNWDSSIYQPYFIGSVLIADSNLFPPSSKAIALNNQPIIVSPKNNSLNVSTNDVLVEWDSITFMDKYHLQLSTDSVFNIASHRISPQSSNMVLDTIIASLDFALPPLKKNTRYYWRVAGINEEGQSRWSDIFSFTTGISASVANEEIETMLSISNYPNPAINSTTITYSLPLRSNATLAIYDVMGREIATLVSEEQSATTHQIQWDTHQVPSGSYLIRLNAGGKNITKLIQVLK